MCVVYLRSGLLSYARSCRQLAIQAIRVLHGLNINERYLQAPLTTWTLCTRRSDARLKHKQNPYPAVNLLFISVSTFPPKEAPLLLGDHEENMMHAESGAYRARMLDTCAGLLECVKLPSPVGRLARVSRYVDRVC